MNRLVVNPKTLRVAAVGLVLAAATGWGLVTLASAQDKGGDEPRMMQHGGGSGEHRGGGMMGLPGLPLHGRMLDDLKVTPQQREQLQKIMEANRPAQPTAEQTAARQAQWEKILTQPKVSLAEVQALHQQMQAEREAQAKRMTQAMVDAANVLTQAQRQQLVQKMAQMKQQRGGDHEGRHGGPQGGERRLPPPDASSAPHG